jgi:hypothetical protein
MGNTLSRFQNRKIVNSARRPGTYAHPDVGIGILFAREDKFPPRFGRPQIDVLGCGIDTAVRTFRSQCQQIPQCQSWVQQIFQDLGAQDNVNLSNRGTKARQ